MKQIIYYTTKNNKSPYFEWYKKLDNSIRCKIVDRIDGLEEGNFGDYKRLSNELIELRFKKGSGYRIYCMEQENILVIILCAGDKSTQSKDIEKAKIYIKDFKERFQNG